MQIKIPVIIMAVVSFATASVAQLQPNSTNPESLQLRFSTYIPEEYGYWYQYFEWDAATDQELFLNVWSLDGSTVSHQHTPLKIRVKGYANPFADNILSFDGKIESEEIEVKNLSMPDSSNDGF